MLIILDVNISSKYMNLYSLLQTKVGYKENSRAFSINYLLAHYLIKPSQNCFQTLEQNLQSNIWVELRHQHSLCWPF